MGHHRLIYFPVTPRVIALVQMRLAVEVMGGDVVGDTSGEKVSAGIAGLEAVPEIGGGDVFVDGLKEVDAGLLVGSEVERGEVIERKAWAADDDPFREFEEVAGVAPAGEIEEAVGADEDENCVAGQELMEGREGLDGVVGSSVGMGRVERGDTEARVGNAGEGKHRDAIGEGRRRALWFERLASCGREEDLVQIERIGRRGGDRKVAAVGWVEGSAKESNAHELFSRETSCLGLLL
jgi:hypothetical protein